MEMNAPAGTHLSAADADNLGRSAKWARFLGIVGFIMVGLMVLLGIFGGSMMARMMSMQSRMQQVQMEQYQGMEGMEGLEQMQNMQESMAGAATTFFMVIILICALLYFFPSLFCYRFGTRTLKALSGGTFDAAAFSAGMDNLRKLFTFVGILTIILLCIYLICFLVMLAGGMMM
jgi:hypothetical protein